MDYSTLTDEQINQLVLMRLGYHAVEERGVWSIADPNGELMGAYRTEASAWNSQRHLGWATNLNAAAALDFGDHILQVYRYPPPDGAMARVFSPTLDPLFAVKYEIEARARTVAWLMFVDTMAKT